METKATLSSTVATICLGTQTPGNDLEMTVTGWGGMDKDANPSPKLKEVSSKIFKF